MMVVKFSPVRVRVVVTSEPAVVTVFVTVVVEGFETSLGSDATATSNTTRTVTKAARTFVALPSAAL